LAQAAGAVTDFERAVIQSGERSGAVAAVLERLAGFLEAQAQLRERVGRALIYPAVVVGCGIAVAIVMLVFMVPGRRRCWPAAGSRCRD